MTSAARPNATECTQVTALGVPVTLAPSPGVFMPTAHGAFYAGAVRVAPGERVIDIGTGSGVLAIAAAHARRHAALPRRARPDRPPRHAPRGARGVRGPPGGVRPAPGQPYVAEHLDFYRALDEAGVVRLFRDAGGRWNSWGYVYGLRVSARTPPV